MKTFSAENIRNIVLAGHASEGKTTLAEAMLYLSGATDRLGRISDGNTVMDYDAEEKKRKVSVSTAAAAMQWKDVKINLLDTPGLFDFAGGAREGFRGADAAVIVISGKTGLSVGAEKAVRLAQKQGKARFFAITKLNAEHTDFYIVLSRLAGVYGPLICPVVVPDMVDGAVKSYINLLEQKAYVYKDGKRSEVAMPEIDSRLEGMNNMLYEAVASTDDALMEKYFEGEPFTYEELIGGLSQGVREGSIIPVYACAGDVCDGVDLLLDGIKEIAPSAKAAAAEIAETPDGEPVELSVDENGPLAAVAFKTIADPFVGKLSFFKVVSGKLCADSTAYNTRTEQPERIGKVVIPFGGKQQDAQYIGAGDIGCVAKLSGTNTGDTLCSQATPLKLAGVRFPAPSLSMAIKAKKKGDEEKIVSGILRLVEEDPTLSFSLDSETREQIIRGLGEQHLDVVVSKLKTKFGVEVTLETPRVAYRETIKHKVKVQGKHKKQSGGHGQYGDVWIEFEPYNTDDLVFAENVFGGSVPKNFFPAVEKGLRDSIKKGVLAGFPVVGVKATLVDGSYHPVDSSEMAFKTAASLAFKAAMAAAAPTLLEPIGMLKVDVPDDNMGDIIGDINKRRGRVLGMEPAEDRLQEIIAEVPMAEMADFSTALRSVTQGRGSFSLTFERYEEAPAPVIQKVIAQAKADEE